MLRNLSAANLPPRGGNSAAESAAAAPGGGGGSGSTANSASGGGGMSRSRLVYALLSLLVLAGLVYFSIVEALYVEISGEDADKVVGGGGVTGMFVSYERGWDGGSGSGSGSGSDNDGESEGDGEHAHGRGAVVQWGMLAQLKQSIGYCSPHFTEAAHTSTPSSSTRGLEQYTFVSGAEGAEEGNGGLVGGRFFQLNHVAVTIRHGDRNAIHIMPQAKHYGAVLGEREQSGGARTLLSGPDSSDAWLDPRALEYEQLLAAPGQPFLVREVDSAEESVRSGRDHSDVGFGGGGGGGYITRTLEPSRLFPRPERHAGDIDNAQLTTRGFMQHVSLGKHLQRAYGRHFPRLAAEAGGRDDRPVQGVFVRSTGYDRTVQSAAALLLGLFPQFTALSAAAATTKQLKQAGAVLPIELPVVINVVREEEADVMHGVGLRTASMEDLEARLARKGSNVVGKSPPYQPWKSLPVSQSPNPRSSMAFDNGCRRSYELALQQQYAILGRNQTSHCQEKPQQHGSKHAVLAACGGRGNDLRFMHNSLAPIVSNGVKAQASAAASGNAAAAIKAHEKLVSMGVTDLTDSMLVPICHSDDSGLASRHAHRHGRALGDGNGSDSSDNDADHDHDHGQDKDKDKDKGSEGVDTDSSERETTIFEAERAKAEEADRAATEHLFCANTGGAGGKGKKHSVKGEDNGKGTDKCISTPLLHAMKSSADTVYCERYSGRTDGGLESTQLSIYPLLAEILGHLKSNAASSSYCADIAGYYANSTATARVPAAHLNNEEHIVTGYAYGRQLCGAASVGAKAGAGADSGKQNAPSSSAHFISVFSGHDTVILPVVSALGVFADVDVAAGGASDGADSVKRDHHHPASPTPSPWASWLQSTWTWAKSIFYRIPQDESNRNGRVRVSEASKPLQCRWPPYASRVVFELYTPTPLTGSEGSSFASHYPFYLRPMAPSKASSRKQSSSTNFSSADELVLRAVATGDLQTLQSLYTTGTRAANPDVAPLFPKSSFLYEPYVRILYNGEVLTPRMQACQQYHRGVRRAKIQKRGREALNLRGGGGALLNPKEGGIKTTGSMLGKGATGGEAPLPPYWLPNQYTDNRRHNGVFIDESLCPLSVVEAYVESLLATPPESETASTSAAVEKHNTDAAGVFYAPGYKHVSGRYKEACSRSV